MTNVQSKLWTRVEVPCRDHLHPWTNSCIEATNGMMCFSSSYCLRLYAIFYGVALLSKLAQKKRLKNVDFKRTLNNYIRSCAFLIINGSTFPFYSCLIRYLLGYFNRFSIIFVPAFLSSLSAISIERGERRSLLTLYVANIATETIWQMLVSRGIVRSIPFGEYYIFAFGISMLLYLHRLGFHKRSSTEGDAIFKILDAFLGKTKKTKTVLTKSDLNVKTSKLIHCCTSSVRNCQRYAISGGIKSFSVGIGLQFLLRIFMLRKRHGIWRELFQKNFFDLAIFLGGFTLIYRGVNCLLRYNFGFDDARFAIPAGCLASLAYLKYPNKSIALYLVWKVLQIVHELGVEHKFLPHIPGFSMFLYAFCTATLFHAAILEPLTIRHSYFKFLYKISGERLCKFNLKPFDAFGYETTQKMQQMMDQLNIVPKSPLPKSSFF